MKKSDTEDLKKQMVSLFECLGVYCNLSLDRVETEISEGSSETVEVIDNLLDSDESNLLRIMYGKKVGDLKDKMGALRISLSEVQKAAYDLSFRIYKDSEVLG